MSTRVLACGLVLLFAVGAAAEVIGFVDKPESNSVDWRDKIAELGGEVNEEVNFDTHPVGAIVPDHYADIGVTIEGTGSVSQVVTGAGPGQGNDWMEPKSEGEGLHPASNHVHTHLNPGTFTVSFDRQITGAGMFLIDLFNPEGNFHKVTLQAFTGPNGTGDLLGTFKAAGFNFQKNFMYFIGVVSTDGDIGSIRITVTGAGDMLGLDDVLFAGGLDCGLLKKFKVKCSNNKLKVKINSNLEQGAKLTILIVDEEGKEEEFPVTINNRGKTKLKLRNQTGKKTVSITQCPEFEKEVDCGE